MTSNPVPEMPAGPPMGSAAGIPRPPDDATPRRSTGVPPSRRRRWTRLRIMVPIVVIIAVIAYFVGRRDQAGSLDSLRVGDCIATPDATGFTTVDVVDCSKPHTQEVYAVGSTTEKVSTGPSADSDPELYRICRTDVDLRIIRALNNSRTAEAGFLIGSDRTGRVVCTAITAARTGSVVEEFTATD